MGMAYPLINIKNVAKTTPTPPTPPPKKTQNGSIFFSLEKKVFAPTYVSATLTRPVTVFSFSLITKNIGVN